GAEALASGLRGRDRSAGAGPHYDRIGRSIHGQSGRKSVDCEGRGEAPRLMAARVEVWRGAVVESRHDVSVAVVDAAGRLRAWAGEPHLVTYARSAIKPF